MLQKMWWKVLGIILVFYAIIAGLLVPLKSGIQRAVPEVTTSGAAFTTKFYGYNTFFTKAASTPTRVWLAYDDKNAVLAHAVKAINDTILEASFNMPPTLPKGEASAFLNVIVDHPEAGTSLLPSGITVRLDTANHAADTGVNAWQQSAVGGLHVQKGFSFPYQNVIYESIRNTYFHVPMWFALMFLFVASVWNSVLYLSKPSLERDRRAVAYTEMGVLFGFLGLFTGMIWAHYAWGAAWSNDIKQLMTAVALLIYLAYFILRSSFEEPEKGARLGAVYNIFAFASLIPLLYVVPRLFASLHPGATGNPAFGSQDLDNTMRMVFYPAIIGWTLVGFWMAELRFRAQRLRDRAAGDE